MRKCFPTRRIVIVRPWDHRGLRTSRRTVSREPAVRQLSNAELLEILYQDKQDASSTATAQPISDGLDSQEDDSLLQTPSLLAPRISRLLQSPLTDPGLVAARIRHKAVKPLPSGDRSLFQLKLQKNSYGIRALTSGTKHRANQDFSHCVSDSTSTMRLNRPSTAKLLPNSIWCRDPPKNWGTMASSKALSPSNVQFWRRRDTRWKSRRELIVSSEARYLNDSKNSHSHLIKHTFSWLTPSPRTHLEPHTSSLQETDAVSLETGPQRQITRDSLARRHGYLCPGCSSEKCIKDIIVSRFQAGSLCRSVQEL